MYRTIDTAFWTDPKMHKLDKDGKLLCLYLVTCPHGHVGGIYHLPDEIVALETGIKIETLDTLWNTLSSVGFCRRDQEIGIVWVRKMFFYQGRGEKNQRAVANHLETLHNSFLVNEFCAAYPVVRKFRKDRVSIGYPELGESGIQDQDQDQDQDQESSKDDSSMSAARTKSYPDCFEEWWLAYPKQLRVGKGKTYSAYQKAGKDLVASGKTKSEVVKFLLERVKEFAASNRGKRTDLSLNPATWLSQGRYDDAPEAWQLVSSNGHATTTEDDMPTNYAYYPKEGVAK